MPASITIKTPEEINAEIESLQNKLKSIDNLTSFVEKKFAAGKLSQKNYDRQINKLEKDKKVTSEKIKKLQEEITEDT